MHIFGIPTVEDEEIPEAVRGLGDEALLDLQHELQAAVTYHNHAQSYGDQAFTHETFFGGGASRDTSEEKVANASQFKEIMGSDLYHSAVRELADRNGDDVSEDFVGWAYMTQEEIEETDYALDTFAQRDVAEKLGSISSPDEEDLKESKTILNQQDIEGYFVRADNLNREFTAHYTLGPSTGGEWS